MNREQLIFDLKQKKCLNGGIKEACIKVRNYTRNAVVKGGCIQAPHACVLSDEFLNAVGVLLAYASDKEDVVPQRWYCDNDCVHAPNPNCKGAANIDKTSKNPCPYYVTEDK